MKFKFLLIPISLALFACMNEEDDSTGWVSNRASIKIVDGIFTDSRDKNQYKVIKIEKYYWMAENLNYQGGKEKDEIWCLKDDKENCKKYGALYTYASAKEACPNGWDLPSNEDWNYLRRTIDTYNGDEGVGTSLKDAKSWDESDSAPKGTNRFRLAMLASGRRNNDGIDVKPDGKYAYYWTSSYRDQETAYGWALHYDTDVFDSGYYYLDHGMSVRCITYAGNVKIETTDAGNWQKEPLELDYGSLKVDGNNKKTDSSWCIKGDESYCNDYGRFYSWNDASSVCPEGWHLPSANEVDALYNYVVSLQSLKATSGWNDTDSTDQNGTDNWGFAALPAGGYAEGSSYDFGKTAYFWLSDEIDENHAGQFVFKFYDKDGYILSQKKSVGNSVRCVKD